MKLFTPEAKEQRNKFLTIICILTMVFCTYSLYESAASLIIGKPSQESFEETQRELKEELAIDEDMTEDEIKMMKMVRDSMLKFNEQSREYFTEIVVLNLVIAIIGLLGALLMFNLDKRGFGLYITSCLLWVFGWTMFFDSNVIINTLMVLCGVISLVFIFMYGMNLKHMKLKYF